MEIEGIIKKTEHFTYNIIEKCRVLTVESAHPLEVLCSDINFLNYVGQSDIVLRTDKTDDIIEKNRWGKRGRIQPEEEKSKAMSPKILFEQKIRKAVFEFEKATGVKIKPINIKLEWDKHSKPPVYTEITYMQ